MRGVNYPAMFANDFLADTAKCPFGGYRLVLPSAQPPTYRPYSSPYSSAYFS